MQPDTIYQPVSPPQNNTEPPRKSSPLKKIILSMLVVVLCVGIGVGGYFLATQMNKTRSATQSTANTTAKTDNTTPDAHFVLSKGYPFDTDKVITAKLGVPSQLQALLSPSSIQDPGYTTILADKFNEEMGRWAFGLPSSPRPYYGDISLVRIAPTWPSQPTDQEQRFNGADPLGISDVMTSAQKSTFLTSLKNDTATCAVDPSKGYVISKFLNVCYELQQIRQSLGSYSPYLSLKGFGTIDGNDFIIVGTLSLQEDKEYSEEEADKLSNDFAAGTISAQTSKQAAQYINALKQTTVTSEVR